MRAVTNPRSPVQSVLVGSSDSTGTNLNAPFHCWPSAANSSRAYRSAWVRAPNNTRHGRPTFRAAASCNIDTSGASPLPPAIASNGARLSRNQKLPEGPWIFNVFPVSPPLKRRSVNRPPGTWRIKNVSRSHPPERGGFANEYARAPHTPSALRCAYWPASKASGRSSVTATRLMS